MKSEIIEAIKALAKEKDINEEMLFTAVEEAVKAAFRKNLPKDTVEPANLAVNMSREDGSIHVYARMLVVDEVTVPASQISMDKAKVLRPGAQMDDIIEVDVTPRGFLRVAAQTAKQVIVQRIREAERGKVYDEYVEKTAEILTAVVQRIDNRGAYVELGHTAGVLDNSEMIPGEVLHEGDHIKVYVLEVQRGTGTSARGPQVRVSRINKDLIKRLFEMEVPEIAAGIVTIKNVSREPGSRAKMAVYSSDPMIDPVGACVGQRGGRVDRVVEELRGEKIDIIKWSEDPVEYVANALNPAHVLSVYTADQEKACRVVVPDNQLSLAIGKEGQNARLAAKLTGWKIDIKSQSQAAELADMVDEPAQSAAPAVSAPMVDTEFMAAMDDEDTL